MNIIEILGIAIGLAMDAFSVCVAAGAAINAYDHWVTLAILAVLGGKMLWESFKGDKDGEEEAAKKDPSRGMTLVMLAFATSVDAAAVGFSFSALDVGVFMPAIVIGIGVKIFVGHLVAG